MDPLHSQDAFLYKKCKQRVSRKLFLTFAFLILYCVGVYIGFDTALLQVDSNGFTILLATVLLVQLCIYSILFLLLASGSKILVCVSFFRYPHLCASFQHATRYGTLPLLYIADYLHAL